MTRSTRRRARSGASASNVVVDVLSCLAALALLLVIRAVLELGTVSYRAAAPVLEDPLAGGRTVVVVAEDRTVRVLDVGGALEVLLSGIEIVRAPDLPVFVDQANARPPPDPNFLFRLRRTDRFTPANDPIGAMDLLIEERPGAVGDSLHRLGSGSETAARLDALDPSRVSLVFTLDSVSVQVFREARAMARERGFVTDWDPILLDFPVTYPLTGREADDFLRVERARVESAR